MCEEDEVMERFSNAVGEASFGRSKFNLSTARVELGKMPMKTSRALISIREETELQYKSYKFQIPRRRCNHSTDPT
jgi:hypothetical protein